MLSTTQIEAIRHCAVIAEISKKKRICRTRNKILRIFGRAARLVANLPVRRIAKSLPIGRCRRSLPGIFGDMLPGECLTLGSNGEKHDSRCC